MSLANAQAGFEPATERSAARGCDAVGAAASPRIPPAPSQRWSGSLDGSDVGSREPGARTCRAR